MEFDPTEALAIIVGASHWPHFPHLDSSSKSNPFQAAAQEMRDYFINSLQLSEERVLWLFDSPGSHDDYCQAIKKFLNDKISDVTPPNTDLFIYFVGHGQKYKSYYYLCIQSTSELQSSHFKIEYLVDVINPVVAKLRCCYIIIDACYSGSAYDELRTLKKVRTLLLCSSSLHDGSQGAAEEITRFTGALLTVLKQPQEGDRTFLEVYSSILEYIETPTPEIHDINPKGNPATKEKILPSHLTADASKMKPFLKIKSTRRIVLKKLKQVTGLVVLLGLLGGTGKFLYDWLTTVSDDQRIIQQLQQSISLPESSYQEDFRHLVVELSLAGLELTVVPAEVWQLKNLRKLDLSNNNLENLPEAIGNLKGLRDLNLRKNQLREWPVSLGQLKRLERLDLRLNQLKELPTEITSVRLGLKWQPQNDSDLEIFLAGNPLETQLLDRFKKGMTWADVEKYFGPSPKEIQELEKVIGKRLPLLDKIEGNSLGYRLNEKNQVVDLLLLSDMGLTEMPENIWQLQQLERLWLSSNDLTQLPKEIGQLQQLEWLVLNNNQLTNLPEEIGQLQQLNGLFLSDNRLTHLPSGVSNLKMLKKLSLANNQLKELPVEIDNLKQLSLLDLSGNRLIQLPKEISSLKKLESLDLGKNSLVELPPEIVSLELELKFERRQEWAQKGIFLGDNPLQVPPPKVIQQGREAVVKYFEQYPVIQELEKAIGKKLTLLEKGVDEWDSQSYTLDEKGQVVRLSLANMNLTEVPKEIWPLQQLTHLSLRMNQLTQLPPEIGQLRQLRRLVLETNLLTDLPKELAQLQQLRYLNLWNNKLSSLPSAILDLKDLSDLFLTNNQLTELSPEIDRLQQLSTLNLSWNRLIQLPNTIANLKQLSWLDLHKNQLTLLPKKIGHLTKLGFFNVSDNRLTELPKEIGLLELEFKWEVGNSFRGDSGLYLGGNPLQVPPPKVIQQGREAVVKYFQERGR